MKNNIRMMLTFSALIFALNVNAQTSSSNLPLCQGANTAAWNQCFGTKNYPNGDKYVGEWVGGKANGQGTYTSKASAATYTGQFAADTFSGDGTMTWANGAKFIGQWKNDSAVSGTITYANGTTAVGTIRNAVFYASAQQPQAVAVQQPPTVATQQKSTSKLPPCPTGENLPPWHMCFGKWSDADGSSYTGEYRAGVPHGQGILSAADGSSQTGEFEDGVFKKGDYKQPDPRIAAMNRSAAAPQQPVSQQQIPQSKLPPCQGIDTFKWDMCSGTREESDGTYVGEWQKGYMRGQGTYTFINGDSYKGTFVNDKFSGQGKYRYADGRELVGEFKDGVANGAARLTSPAGVIITGEFRNGLPHGQVSFHDINGDVVAGEFRNGLPHGKVSMSSSNGEKYVGDFLEKSREGFGTHTHSNGSTYQGQFKNNDYNGQGTYTAASGEKYTGEFKDGDYNGKGTLITASGEKFVGEFKDGQYVSTQAKQNVANKIIDTTNVRTIRGSCRRVTQMLPEYDLDINLYARIVPENERLGKLLSSLSTEGWTSGERNYGDGYAFTAGLCQGGSGSWRKNCTSADLRREYDKCVALYR
jgi:hypothetical protein